METEKFNNTLDISKYLKIKVITSEEMRNNPDALDDIKPIDILQIGNHKSKTKLYVKKYNEEYYKQNKEKNLQHLAEKVECEICKCEIARSSISEHKRTNKHRRNLDKKVNLLMSDTIKTPDKTFMIHYDTIKCSSLLTEII